MNALSSRKRYLSVWLRRLTTDGLIRSRSSVSHAGVSQLAHDAPLVVTEPVKGALRLAAVNDAAARLGLNPGLALADARAMFPRIAIADADPEADRRTLTAIADWCDCYTPLVGLDPPDGLLLDISGCAHLFGGEAALCRDLVARLEWQGFQARAAIADTVGCAWAVARYGECFLLDRDTSRNVDISRGQATGFPPPLRGRDREGGNNEDRTRSHPPPHPSPSERAFTPVFDGLWGEGAHRVRSTLIIPSDQTRDVLLPLPLAALRITPETVAELAQVGLKRIADVIDRPRAPLAARFGTDFVRRIDQAVGCEDEPITPRLPVPSYVTERRFAEPIALEADVLSTIEHLATELARLMERRGEGARLIEVALFRTDGKVHRIAAGTGAPLRDAARIRALFVERLAAIGDECDPGFGYDVVRLGARATERCDPVQTGLATADHAVELAHLVDRLGARFGLRRVMRLMPQDTHIPEYAVSAVAAASSLPSPLWGGSLAEAERRRAGRGSSETYQRCYPPPHPSPNERAFTPVFDGLWGEGARERAPLTLGSIKQDSLAPIRPVRLFERPEPIEAIAEVPDGPPVQFTWRRVRYAVTHVEGPERIAMEWWRDAQGQALTRDYFRVESREGMRVWLYRQGLFNDPLFNEHAQPRWFLHGVFA